MFLARACGKEIRWGSGQSSKFRKLGNQSLPMKLPKARACICVHHSKNADGNVPYSVLASNSSVHMSCKKAWALARQNPGWYSFNGEVLNLPDSSLPIEAPCGSRLVTNNVVGFAGGGPNSPCNNLLCRCSFSVLKAQASPLLFQNHDRTTSHFEDSMRPLDMTDSWPSTSGSKSSWACKARRAFRKPMATWRARPST